MSDPNTVKSEDMDDDALVRDALKRLNHALDVRSEMFVRVAVRVTAIIRTGMISAGVISVFVFLLVLVMAWQFDNMVSVMTTMNQRFRTMSEDMSKMRDLMAQMDTSVQSMPAIVERVQSMEGSVQGMSGDMDIITAEMGTMDQNIDQVRFNVVRMTNTFNSMDAAVYGIGRDVNVMSGPMKDFNSMRSIVPLP